MPTTATAAPYAPGTEAVVAAVHALEAAWADYVEQAPYVADLARAAKAYQRATDVPRRSSDTAAVLTFRRGMHVAIEADHIADAAGFGLYERALRPHTDRLMRLVTVHRAEVHPHTFPTSRVFPRLGKEIITARDTVWNVWCLACDYRDQFPKDRQEAAEFYALRHGLAWAVRTGC